MLFLAGQASVIRQMASRYICQQSAGASRFLTYRKFVTSGSVSSSESSASFGFSPIHWFFLYLQIVLYRLTNSAKTSLQLCFLNSVSVQCFSFLLKHWTLHTFGRGLTQGGLQERRWTFLISWKFISRLETCIAIRKHWQSEFWPLISLQQTVQSKNGPWVSTGFCFSHPLEMKPQRFCETSTASALCDMHCPLVLMFHITTNECFSWTKWLWLVNSLCLRL